jgi:endonuclease/exonuclease/phosphatase family metal-dependent hydrolase
MSRRVNPSVRDAAVALFAAAVWLSASPVAEAQTNETLPSGWSTRDIGSVGVAGQGDHVGGRYTLSGSGRDIWDNADGFRFVYRTLTGNGEIVARVESLQPIHQWSKAGVMMREGLTAGARHAFMLVSPSKGLAFQRRGGTNGPSSHTSGGAGRDPHWVRLVRSGDTFTAYRSTTGSSWTVVGSQTIPMASTVYVGLAVTSHDNSRSAGASFTDVVVRNTTSVTVPSTPSSSSSTFRLLHWNTQHGGRGTDGRYDPARLVSWILKSDPHVASLNEIGNTSQLNAILNELHKQTGTSWSYQWDDRGNALVTRLPVTSRSICWVNSSVGRKAAHLGVAYAGRTINVWSAHLALDSSSMRTSEVRALKACASNDSEQRIVAGDFNTQQSSPEIAEMGRDYIDAWPAAKALGKAIDYPGNTRDGATRNSRIDYVFMSRGATSLALQSAQIFDTRDAKGHMPSDHKPLLVTYTVR